MPHPVYIVGFQPDKLVEVCWPAGCSQGEEGGRQGEEGQGGSQEAGGELSLMMSLSVAAMAVLICQ